MGGGGGTRGGRAQRGADISSYYDGGGGHRPFEYGGTDSPSAPSLLFDPEAEQPNEGYQDESNLTYGPRPIGVRWDAHVEAKRYIYISSEQVQRIQQAQQADGVVQAQATQPAQPQPTQPGVQPPMPMQPGAQPPAIVAPNPDTTAIVTQDGTLIIRARNQEELDRIVRMIREVFIPLLTQETQVTLRVKELKYADSTQMVNDLQQIFSRLQIGSGSISFPQGNQRFPGGGFGGQFGGQQGQTLGQFVLLPLPRFNAILIGAPKASEELIVKQIDMLDQPNASSLQPRPYYLKNAAASIVQTQLLNLFRQRYPSDLGNNIQVTVDTANNAVHVQAGPADQKDIEAFIQLLDAEPGTAGPGATNEVKVIRLRNAFASEMATVLFEVLSSNVFNPQASTAGSGGTGAVTTNPFATGGGAGLNQAGGGQFGLGTQNQLTGGTTASTKSTTLQFIDPQTRLKVRSGLLADVTITPDARVNALIVSAPEKTMQLVEALVKELDGVAAAKSYVKVFPLKKADATAVQTLLVNLFSRQTTGVGGAAFGGAQLGLGGAAATQGTTRPLLTLTGAPGDGSALIDLRLTPDTRTNSLIVAGSQNDLDLVQAVIGRLEATEVPQYATEVVKLRNAAAADVASALTTFLTQVNPQVSGLVNPAGGVAATSTYTGFLRQYFIQPEPISNQLLIGATPALMPELLRLIQAVDAAPPQVFVEVLIAEVKLSNQEEFGVEVGLQGDVLFARGGATAGGTPGTPGYNFNTTAALPNTTNVNPSKVGFQGLGNLGVGRSGSAGVGGFVLSAASDSFSLLIRALKAQGRVDVLSRPTLMLTDNQTGFFQVGQQFPRITGSTNTVNGVTQNIEYVPVGIVLRVTPRISPDGQVLMRVEPQISAPNQTQVTIAPGIFAVGIDTQTVETTVLAGDGETVVLGGLIRKSDQKIENKIPLLGDIPYLGAAFRYRTQQQERREIVFIMTPRVGRTRDDLRQIFAAEARKMSWSITDAANVSGQNPDLFRGKLDPACVDTTSGPPPAYLPYSTNGAIAPTYYPTQTYGQTVPYIPAPPTVYGQPGFPTSAAPQQAVPQYQAPPTVPTTGVPTPQPYPSMPPQPVSAAPVMTYPPGAVSQTTYQQPVAGGPPVR
jgi:type II secretion system protein D